MPRSSRSQALWDVMKRSAVQDMRGLIEEQAPRVGDAIRVLSEQLTAVLNAKAPRNHTHPPGEVTGLQATIVGLNARVTALEAIVVTFDARLEALETPEP